MFRVFLLSFSFCCYAGRGCLLSVFILISILISKVKYTYPTGKLKPPPANVHPHRQTSIPTGPTGKLISPPANFISNRQTLIYPTFSYMWKSRRNYKRSGSSIHLPFQRLTFPMKSWLFGFCSFRSRFSDFLFLTFGAKCSVSKPLWDQAEPKMASEIGQVVLVLQYDFVRRGPKAPMDQLLSIAHRLQLHLLCFFLHPRFHF